MQIIRRLFRHATWFALVAILGLALAPTVSHALVASGSDSPWAEICTDAGSAPSGSAVHLEHCPLCGPSAQALPVPSPATASVAAASGRDPIALRWLALPARPLPWSPYQPGAPPASA